MKITVTGPVVHLCPYVDEVDHYAPALQAIGVEGIEIVASRGSLTTRRATPFASLTELRPTPAVGSAFARVRL